jgi:hypothetical protein
MIAGIEIAFILTHWPPHLPSPEAGHDPFPVAGHVQTAYEAAFAAHFVGQTRAPDWADTWSALESLLAVRPRWAIMLRSHAFQTLALAGGAGWGEGLPVKA